MTKRKQGEQEELFTDQEIQALPVEVRNRVDTAIAKSHPRATQLIAAEKITKANLEVRLSDAAALVDFYNRAEDLIIKRTKNEDWLMIGDSPYPLESAVKKAHMTIGSKIKDIRIEEDKVIEQIQGGDFSVIYFTAYGTVCFNGQEAEAIGTASTKDQFFAERTREKKDGSGNVVKENDRPVKEKYLLPLEDVSIMNVKKKSVTNLYKRTLDLIFRLNPTKEKLADLGITPKSGFTFAGGSKGGSTDTPADKETRTKMKTILASLSAATGQSTGEVLKGVTYFEKAGSDPFPGYTDPSRVSSKMLGKTMKKLEDLAKKAGI